MSTAFKERAARIESTVSEKRTAEMDSSEGAEEPVKEANGGNEFPSHKLYFWWREPAAGFIAVGLGAFDVWHFGRDAGFTSSLDEILILTGVALIAGVRNLFGTPPPK